MPSLNAESAPIEGEPAPSGEQATRADPPLRSHSLPPDSPPPDSPPRIPPEIARKPRSQPKSAWRRTLKHARRAGVSHLAVALVKLAALIPRRLTDPVSRILGSIAWVVLPSERSRTLSQLSVALSADATLAERRRIGKGVFRHFSYLILECLVFGRWGYRRLHRDVEFHDWDRLTDVVNSLQERGKGVIVVAPHLGNWELIGSLGCRKWGNSVCVGKRYSIPAYDRLVYGNRHRMGVDTLYSDEPIIKGVRLLRRRGVIGLLPDLDARRYSGVFARFFSLPAYTSDGPATLALRLGAPLLPLACVREGRGYRFVWEDPIFPEDYAEIGNVENGGAVQRITQDWLTRVERLIRRYPEQWVWMHKRWNSTPESVARRQQRLAGVGDEPPAAGG